jgi:hypothetical protein
MIWDFWLYFRSEGCHPTDFFALKNPLSWLGLNLQTLGPMASTINTRPLLFYFTVTGVVTQEDFIAF